MVAWSIESALDRDYILKRAEELGWLETPPKVQVKQYKSMEYGEVWYVIEPYEENCNCPNLIKPSMVR